MLVCGCKRFKKVSSQATSIVKQHYILVCNCDGENGANEINIHVIDINEINDYDYSKIKGKKVAYPVWKHMQYHLNLNTQLFFKLYGESDCIIKNDMDHDYKMSNYFSTTSTNPNKWNCQIHFKCNDNPMRLKDLHTEVKYNCKWNANSKSDVSVVIGKRILVFYMDNDSCVKAVYISSLWNGENEKRAQYSILTIKIGSGGKEINRQRNCGD